jgi:YVTN family beta-propeller protein
MSESPHRVKTILLAFALSVLLSSLVQGWAEEAEAASHSRVGPAPVVSWTAPTLSKAGSPGQPQVEATRSISSDQPERDSTADSGWIPPEVYSIKVPGGVQAIAYDNVTQKLFALAADGDNVSVISGLTDAVVASIPFNATYTGSIGGITVDTQDGFVYAAYSQVVVKINESTEKVVNYTNIPGNIPVSGDTLGSFADILYVAHLRADNVLVINTTTGSIVRTIGVGLFPDAVAYDPLNEYSYVTNFDGGDVSVIDTSNDSVLGTIPAGTGPIFAAVDTRNGDVYVSNQYNMTVINGTTGKLIGWISMPGGGPIGVAYENSTGYVYATNQAASTVIVVDGASNSVVATVKVGGPGVNPIGVATGGPGGCVYVDDLGSRSVSVLAPPIKASVSAWSNETETGTPDLFTAKSTEGLPPYSPRQYSWDFGDGTWLNGTNASALHAYWKPGTYTVNVTAEDIGGHKAYAEMKVTETPGPMVSTPQPSRPRADANQTVTFTTNATGGTLPYTDYKWTGIPSSCQVGAWSSLTCSFAAPGNYSITVAVTDIEDASSLPSGPLSFRVYPDPVATISANRTSIEVGQWVSWSAVAGFGYGGYQFGWSGLPPGCTGNEVVTCQVTNTGQYSIASQVTDGNGFTATSNSVSLIVYPALSLTGLHGPGVAKVAQNVSFNAVSAGGVPPLNYTWWFGDGSIEIGGSTAFHDYSAAGNYTVRVDVSDGGNVTQSATLHISIEKPAPTDQIRSKGPPPTFFGLPDWEAIGLIGGLAGAVAVTTALIVRRKRGR